MNKHKAEAAKKIETMSPLRKVDGKPRIEQRKSLCSSVKA